MEGAVPQVGISKNTSLPRVNNKEEESVEHAFEPSINCLESNVTSAKAHVM